MRGHWIMPNPAAGDRELMVSQWCVPAGCIEVNPTNRRVRQALGPQNRPLSPAVTASVFQALQRCGVSAT